MSPLVRCTALVLAGLGLFSCVPLDRLAMMESRSFTLTPALEGIHQTTHSYQSGVCPFVNRQGGASPALAEFESAGGADRRGMLMGFSANVIRGADPIPCDIWQFHMFQAKMLFDFSELPEGAIVQQADLEFSRGGQLIPDFGSFSTPCRYRVGTASGVSTADLSVARGPDGQRGSPNPGRK